MILNTSSDGVSFLMIDDRKMGKISEGGCSVSNVILLIGSDRAIQICRCSQDIRKFLTSVH